MKAGVGRGAKERQLVHERASRLQLMRGALGRCAWPGKSPVHERELRLADE